MKHAPVRPAAPGQSMVEFAATSTVLFTLVFGILEFSRAYYYYSTVTNAAQEGARYGIADQNTTCVDNAALSHVVSVGLTAGSVNQSAPDGSYAYGNRIQVTVNYTFTSLVGFVPSLPLQGSATMRVVQQYDSAGVCQ